MNNRIVDLLLVVGVGSALMLVAGCQPNVTKQHQESVNAANQRWLSLRSGLVIQMAQRQFDAGDLDQAEISVSQALKLDAKNPSLYTLAGRIGIERGELEKAYQLLATTIVLDPSSPEAYYYQGVIHQRWQQLDKALNAYQQAYKLKPDSVSYLLAVSEVLAAVERTNDAIQLLISRQAYFDQNAGIRAAIAQLYLMKKQYAKAADYFNQAHLLKPDDVGILEELASAQLQAGRPEFGVKILEELTARSEFRNRRDMLWQLAQGYLMSSRTHDAQGIYLKLTRLDPGDTESWIKLGEVCWKQGDLSGSQLAANRLISQAPRRYEGYLLAGLVHDKQGRFDQALHALDQAAELAPTNALPSVLRGLTLERAGKREAAAEAYLEALRRQPGDKQARMLLAEVEQ